MFKKSKVKGYSRLSKSKSGFKVIRVNEFFRKKDENKTRNIVLGGATAALGVGVTLLLKKKGVNIKNGLKGVTSNTPKYPKSTSIKNKASEMVVDVKAKKVFGQIDDPWETPIEYKINKDLLKPKKRGNLTKKNMLVISDKKKVTDSIIKMSKTQKKYDSLPIELKVVTQMEKALVRPQNASNVGRPLDRITLKKVLNKPIEKATRKVQDRLLREKVIRDNKR